jgi:hypothetical protein
MCVVGSGKSFTAKAIVMAKRLLGRKVAYIAPTGDGAKQAGEGCVTVQAWLGQGPVLSWACYPLEYLSHVI